MEEADLPLSVFYWPRGLAGGWVRVNFLSRDQSVWLAENSFLIKEIIIKKRAKKDRQQLIQRSCFNASKLLFLDLDLMAERLPKWVGNSQQIFSWPNCLFNNYKTEWSEGTVSAVH